MKINFKVPIFSWDIEIIFNVNRDETSKVELLEFIERRKIQDPLASDLIKMTEDPELHGGAEHVYNGRTRYGAIIAYAINDPSEYFEVFAHEVRHLVDTICEFHNLTDRETPAYLHGYIEKTFYEWEVMNLALGEYHKNNTDEGTYKVAPFIDDDPIIQDPNQNPDPVVSPFIDAGENVVRTALGNLPTSQSSDPV